MQTTTAFAAQILDALAKGAAVPGTGAFIALSRTVPAVDGTGWNELSQSEYAGYARVSLAALFGSPTLGALTNQLAVLFPVPTAGGGTINAWGIFTAPTGGTLRAFKAVQPGLPIVVGQAVRFLPSTLTLQVV